MRYISHPREPRPPAARLTILLTLLAATGFEVLAFLSTQDRTIRGASPWQEDPYNTAVSGALFMVPMLAVVLAARLLAWRAPGAPDRARQMLRAAGATIALIGLTAGFQWASVLMHAEGGRWDGWTAALVASLAVVGIPTAIAADRLVRERGPRRAGGDWRHDWLGDAAFICARIPVLRSLVRPALVDRVRAHAVETFIGLSYLAASTIIGALALGEGWTDPLLIGWAIVVETALLFAFCMITNELAGFIARPPRGRRRRTIETSLVAGCLAIQLPVAFHEQIWEAVSGGSLDSIPILVALTLGAGPLAAGATALALRH